MIDYFSERENGPVVRTEEVICRLGAKRRKSGAGYGKHRHMVTSLVP